MKEGRRKRTGRWSDVLFKTASVIIEDLSVILLYITGGHNDNHKYSRKVETGTPDIFTFHRRRTEVQIIYFYIYLYFVYDALFVYFPLLHLKQKNLSRKCV